MSLAVPGGTRVPKRLVPDGTAEHRRPGRGATSRAAPPAASADLALGDDHPLHLIDRVVRETLSAQDDANGDRPDPEAVQPDRERLLRGLLLQVIYAIGCDRRLLEQLRYDLRFRWFVGLHGAEPVWPQTVYAGARVAMFGSVAGRQRFGELLRGIRPIALTWPEHFGFDEDLVDRWRADPGGTAAVAESQNTGLRELLRTAGLSIHENRVEPRLLRVLERILTRICEPGLNCDGLAAEFGMSRRALYYLFDAYGLTPSTVIRNIRLEHCKRLLEDARHRGRKITAIALDHGFGNIYTFSRSFKQRYGVGPRDCRTDPLRSGRAAHG